jgi:hypothetical protein
MFRRLTVVTVAALVALSSGCVSAKEKMEMRYRDGLTAFEPAAMDKAEVDLVWEWNLTDEEAGREGRIEVRRVYLYEDSILVETEDHAIYGFSRANGSALFVAKAAGPLQVNPTLYEGTYHTIAAGRATTIDQRGIVTVGPEFPLTPSAPLLVTELYYYVADATGAVWKLSRENLNTIWLGPVRARGVILARLLVVEDLLLFASSAGEVGGIDFITGERRLDLTDFGPILNGIVSDVVGQRAVFYFGSDDFYVYAYTSLGSPLWRSIVEGRVADTPMLYGDMLLVETTTAGVRALSKVDGAPIWHNESVSDVVGAGGSIINAMTPQSELWFLDAANGEAAKRLEVSEFSFAPRNPFGDGIAYLVSRAGRIVAVKAR